MIERLDFFCLKKRNTEKTLGDVMHVSIKDF